MLHVAVCAYVPSLTHSSLQQKQGLPLLNQIISWTTLGGSDSQEIYWHFFHFHFLEFPLEIIIILMYHLCDIFKY